MTRTFVQGPGQGLKQQGQGLHPQRPGQGLHFGP